MHFTLSRSYCKAKNLVTVYRTLNLKEYENEPLPSFVELGLKRFSFRLTRKMRDRLTVLKFERFNRWILIGEIDDSWFSIVEFPHWIDFVDFEILFYKLLTLNLDWQKSISLRSKFWKAYLWKAYVTFEKWSKGLLGKKVTETE